MFRNLKFRLLELVLPRSCPGAGGVERPDAVDRLLGVLDHARLAWCFVLPLYYQYLLRDDRTTPHY